MPFGIDGFVGVALDFMRVNGRLACCGFARRFGRLNRWGTGGAVSR